MGVTSNERFDLAIITEHRTHGLNLQPALPEQPGTALPPSDLPNDPARGPGWCDSKRRKHHRRYQGRFTRLASLTRSQTAPAAARLLLALVAPLVIMPASAQAQGNAQSATYRVTFEGKWTTSVTPGGLPSGAHFSRLIGAVHNGSVTFWNSGGTASEGVEAVAEQGNTAIFEREINANMNAVAVIEKSLPSGRTPTATVDFTVSTAHPLVTLLTMIAPSPDWFVGVSGLSLLDAQNEWLSQHQVDLFPYNAGTEKGAEFSLTNAATSPQGTITSIKGTGKFSNQPIATLTFDLLAPATPVMSITAGASAATRSATVTVTDADKDAARAPNIVIVLADDLGYGDVGYLNSQSQIPTPNLDTLAGQGMAFLDAHSPSGVCTPTRYGLLTGRYAWRTRLTRGVLNGYAGPLIAPRRETLGSFLGATGYRTAVIGKWHLGLGFAKNALGEFDFEQPIDDGPHTHGFDESYIIPASLDFPPYVYIRDGEITGFPLGQQSGMEFPRFMRAGELASDFDPADVLDELIRQATGFIQRQASDGSPFLLYLPLTAPHKPIWPAQRFEGTTELGPYGDFIVQVDAAVGDVMSALDQAGVDDNTLLIVTSDNGSFMSRLDGLDDRDHTDDSTIQAYRAGNHTANHVYRGTKADIWEGGHRVPFFARWPGEIEPGSTREEVISLTDVFATVAEIVGKELPNNAAEDSFSLLPLLRGKPWARPRAAVTHHSVQGMFAIRDGRWKLVAGNGSGGREDPIGQPFERPYQLFDIASDPSEQLNVYDQHPTVAQRLERELERIRSWDRSRMTTDMAALVDLYNGTNGANWKTNTNWLSEAPLVSLWDWHGVTTDQNGRVTELALASNDLSGTIPAELGDLTKLQRLDLSENELSGAIPLTLMTLSQLSVLDIRSTTLCAPADTAFQAWLATITYMGATCAANTAATGAPTITGTAEVGQTLTAVTTGITDANGLTSPTYTYQWIRVNGAEADISGAMSSTYTLVTADLGKTIKVRVSFDDDVGNTETLTSAATATVVAAATAPTVSNVAVTSAPASGDTYGTGEMIRFTVTFDQEVTVTGTPEFNFCLGSSATVSCSVGTSPPALRSAVLSSGSGTTALVFVYEVDEGDEDTDGVSIEANRLTLNGGTIRDGSNNNAVLDHEEVAADAGHKVDTVKPQLAASGGAVVEGTRLTLTYDEALDGGSRPVSGDFTVSGGDRVRTVTGVRVNGSAVELTLDPGAEHLEAGIRVSYTPGANPIRDVPGNEAESVNQEPVTNETPDTTPPEVSSLAITSNPGGDQIYAAEDEIEVTVRFSETVAVEGTPRLRLRVGSRTRTAGYLRGTDTAVLVFGYEVADGDEDTDGVSIEAGRIDLNGGTIEDQAGNAADREYPTAEARNNQSNHRVDGVRPVLVSTAVDGASLTLSYGEALDGGSRPTTGDFTVEVDGSGRSVTGVSISGRVVTLTLNPAVEHGDTGIRVSYTVPTGVGANPIRDEVGNEARGLSSQSVTNTTGAPNTVPEITSPSSISVRENQAVVRRLAARDTDPGDEVTGWEIVGGADQSQFSIASDTGEMSFREAPDFEAPGDNEYEVRVEVKSGAGARELEAEQTFTISVTDEQESPGVPEAPTFSGETAESLTINWSEPDNTGPAITDYDAQYREKGTGRFTGALHDGPGRTVTLSDLNAGTVYEVQVRATNDEGTGGWSDPGEGMTVGPLRLEMMTMEEPPVSGPFTVRFSFSEPVTGFSASDIDTEQDPECVDDQNNTVFCDPGIGALQTIDDRVFTTTVTPRTDRVAHSYTLTMTVPGGAVRSSVGSKPNEAPEEPLEVRVAPPGVTEPVSSIDLRASPGSGSVSLSWNRPSDNGGSAIIRYEVRNQAVGEAWSEWENVGAGSRGVTVGNLVNGREYIFEVRAVNALGKGGAEAARATPERRIAPPPPPRGGGGGGGGLLFVPEAPLGLMAMPGEGAVRLEWGPPESDGGSPIQRYEYRLKDGREEFGEWTPIADSAPGEVNATGYTVGELDNGTVYVFELRGVNLVGEGRVSEAVEAVMGLDPAYWSNFGAEDLQGGEASLERGPFGGGPQSLRLRFGAGLRFEESELDGEGEVRGTRSGSYGYRYTSRTTGELRLDYDGGEACELRLTFRGVGAGSYSYRCGGVLGGQGSFRMSGLNRGPEITSAGAYEVAENTVRVGRLEAVDGDDEIGGYGIAGGADGGLFAVEAETGELLFREAPDYEDPLDVESAEPASGAADNEYIVVVEVRSGEGERERKGSRAIRVRVSDEEEPPGAPAAPVVTAEGSDSLQVSWTEPENRGPEIVDYEVRYREGGEEGYSDGGHEGTGLEVRLSGLEEGTVYEVQVRAVNEEGMSEWSEPGEGRTDMEEPDPDDPSDFTGEDLEGRRLTLRLEGEEGTAGSLELRFGEGNRFEQIESGGEQAATRSEGVTRSGSYTYEKTGPGRGTVRLDYDDGSSCEIRLSFTETGVGGFAYDCGEGDPAEGSFRLTTGSLFVPVILSSAGQKQSFFTSELTLTNRGDQDVKLDYSYTAHRGGGSGKTSDVLAPGMQKIETDALTYLRGLGVPIPETGNRIGTLRVEARLGSEVEAVVRTTTLVPEGRAGLAYLGVAEEEGFSEAVYLCGLRQNSRDRSNVAFQNMGAEEEGAIVLRTTVYSGESADTNSRVLEDVTLEPGKFHQYSGLLGVLGVPAQGYVKVERVEGRAPFYAYGVINDQANSDGSFIFPVTAGSLEGTAGQTLPVVVETSEFRSELTVTNFSEEPRRLDFQFVAEGIEGDDKTAGFSMTLVAGEQQIIPEVVDELRRRGVAGLGRGSRALAGAVFATAVEGDMSGIVIGARTGSQGGGGQYSVFYNAVPEGGAFTEEAWVDGLQQNEENRSNLALVNTGEVDGSASVFHLEIYDGETGLLAETVVTKPISARRWHQINGILGSYAPETRQGYIRIEKVSGENPFLAYGVVNDGGAPGQRSGDGAYLPARE